MIPGLKEWTDIFTVLWDAKPELFYSLVLGLVGYALVRLFTSVWEFAGSFLGERRRKRWLLIMDRATAMLVAPSVGAASAWLYFSQASPGLVPDVVTIDPQHFIYGMTVVVGIMPGFVVCPLALRLFRKRTESGNTGQWTRRDWKQDAPMPGDGAD